MLADRSHRIATPPRPACITLEYTTVDCIPQLPALSKQRAYGMANASLSPTDALTESVNYRESR